MVSVNKWLISARKQNTHLVNVLEALATMATDESLPRCSFFVGLLGHAVFSCTFAAAFFLAVSCKFWPIRGVIGVFKDWADQTHHLLSLIHI